MPNKDFFRTPSILESNRNARLRRLALVAHCACVKVQDKTHYNLPMVNVNDNDVPSFNSVVQNTRVPTEAKYRGFTVCVSLGSLACFLSAKVRCVITTGYVCFTKIESNCSLYG